MKTSCNDCGTVGNVCRDNDGVSRCRWCSLAQSMRPEVKDSRAVTPERVAELEQAAGFEEWNS